ncbi:phosphoglycerol transferase [Acidovorax sp. 62]|uniref:DUF7024 domain-containing protein n=1 Tax=Acidovorax sp. 62 TaxID=2035203 RepID=UPI000C5D677E|nr:sugar translocase [Acidovorax sp. 62]PIF93508.1 phosphoglycerol transferase [Acidovorax sp. 62]
MSISKIENNNPACSFVKIFKLEWHWWCIGAVFSFVLASVLMTGWPSGIFPDLTYPYIYQGDGLSHSWLTLRAMEGWIFDNPRSGYPFGSSFLDYPGSDSGNLLLLKIIGNVVGNYYGALNLFFLLSFSAIFIASYFSFRAFQLNKSFAFVASLLFAFLPFHFQRLGHLFYLWYFVVPIVFFLCLSFYESEGKFFSLKNIIFLFFSSIALASFGVYYALFGVIAFSVCVFAMFCRSGGIKYAEAPVFVIFFVIFGVLLNIAPNIFNKHLNGENPEVAVRSASEAEIYGFKLMQLILPRAGHREPHLASLTQRYNEATPLVNENVTSSLGVVGAAGLAVLLIVLISALSGRKTDARLSLLVMLIFVFFLFGIIGGLGSLFSSVISSSIRGWNRISIFIAFGAIAAFFILLQIFVERYFSPERSRMAFFVFALIFCGVGLYDQTTSACLACNEQTKAAFESDRNFVAEIEKNISSGAAIYQLPYMPFPEVAPLHRLHTYDLAVGFLHSKELRWSYAGMKGREGDLFYRALAQESVEKQLEVISRMGFSGIYIDRRGFEDNADSLIIRLTALLGAEPLLKRVDGQVVFFRLPSALNADLSGLSGREIMKRSGYVVDKLGARYSAHFSDGIDFTRRNWPEFVRDVAGVSVPEPWGRWSDANLAPGVRFDFFSPLPERFTLVLSARPFSRNGEQKVVVKVGDQNHHLVIKQGDSDVRLPIVLQSEGVDSIEFIPQNPISPKEAGVNGDLRMLGIGFTRLRFEE